MRALQRNQQTLYYRLYGNVITPIETVDEWGNTLETGEYSTGYGDPVKFKANVTPASGANITEQFGNLDNYDKVIVTADMTCPIDEQSVLYIDKTPIQDDVTGAWSAHNYVVRRVARSINSISIAVRKVDVT